MIQDNRQVYFQQSARDALQRNEGHEHLIELVRRFKESGGSQRQAYDALQAIWLEHGFDEDEGDEVNPMRDNLEYVMEVVWGFCSSAEALWEGSLSQERTQTTEIPESIEGKQDANR